MNYLPKDEVQLINWLEKFAIGISEIGHEVGIVEKEVIFINTLTHTVRNDMIRYELGINTDILQKNFTKESLIELVRKIVIKIKTHPQYSDSLHGRKLGIA